MKHDYQGFEVDRSGNICVQQAGSFMCCQHFVCDFNEGRGENKLSVLLSAATADVYKFLPRAPSRSSQEGIWKGSSALLLCEKKSQTVRSAQTFLRAGRGGVDFSLLVF